MTAPADAVPAARDLRLADAVRALRTRTGALPVDTLLRLAGPVLVPLGAVLVLLGWYGAAHTSRVYLQIPYMISGGLLGVGCMFVGGFAFFSRWLDAMLAENRSQSERALQLSVQTVAALDRIESALREQAYGVDADVADGWVRTERGRLYHRASCSMVAGRSVVGVEDPGGLAPCRICQPDD